MKHTLLINLLKEDAAQMKASGDFGWQRTVELAIEALKKVDDPESPTNQQATAWLQVSRTLNEVAPDWLDARDFTISTADHAVNTIRELAKRK